MNVDADPTLGHGPLIAGHQCTVVTGPTLLTTPGTTHQMIDIMEEDTAPGTIPQTTVTMKGSIATVQCPAVSHQGQGGAQEGATRVVPHPDLEVPGGVILGVFLLNGGAQGVALQVYPLVVGAQCLTKFPLGTTLDMATPGAEVEVRV